MSYSWCKFSFTSSVPSVPRKITILHPFQYIKNGLQKNDKNWQGDVSNNEVSPYEKLFSYIKNNVPFWHIYQKWRGSVSPDLFHKSFLDSSIWDYIGICACNVRIGINRNMETAFPENLSVLYQAVSIVGHGVALFNWYMYTS